MWDCDAQLRNVVAIIRIMGSQIHSTNPVGLVEWESNEVEPIKQSELFFETVANSTYGFYSAA